jgi:hypothetical protein
MTSADLFDYGRVAGIGEGRQREKGNSLVLPFVISFAL